MTYEPIDPATAQRRGATFGVWSMLGNPIAVEALGKSGADFVGLDVQHGQFGFEQCIRSIQLLDIMGVTSLVRISCAEWPTIPRYLDAGAERVLLAMVSTPADVQRCVAVSRYQPEGERSYGGQRLGLRPEPADVAQVRPEVLVMIETADALKNICEIGAVQGISGLYVGPVDLGLAIGTTPALSNPAFRSALQQIRDSAHNNQLRTGMFAADGDSAAELAAFGFNEVVVSSDIAQLRAALKSELDRAHRSR